MLIFFFFAVLLTVLNCYNVKWVTKITDLFSLGKVLALAVIILFGVLTLVRGDFSNVKEPMRDSNFEPGAVALSFYSGLFSFAGW